MLGHNIYHLLGVLSNAIFEIVARKLDPVCNSLIQVNSHKLLAADVFNANKLLECLSMVNEWPWGIQLKADNSNSNYLIQ